MISTTVWFIISIIVLWLLVMYSAWNKKGTEQAVDAVTELTPLYNKSTRVARRWLFSLQRAIGVWRAKGTTLATKIFFAIFPKARKAFEEKDALTGLEHGPSSYFLKSISEDLPAEKTKSKKDRRNAENV